MLLVKNYFEQNFCKFLIKKNCQNLPNYHDSGIKQYLDDKNINFLLFAHININLLMKKNSYPKNSGLSGLCSDLYPKISGFWSSIEFGFQYNS